MRLFAHFSKDEQLISLMHNRDNSDIYKLIASYIHNCDIGSITSQQREEAKVITLGLCYGMGVESMAAQLAISTSEATVLKNKILSVFCIHLKITHSLENPRGFKS